MTELREDEKQQLIRIVYDYCEEKMPEVFDDEGLLQGYFANLLTKIDPTWRDTFEAKLFVDLDE